MSDLFCNLAAHPCIVHSACTDTQPCSSKYIENSPEGKGLAFRLTRQGSDVQDLREQVRDLMVYLEASQLAGISELAGGSAEVAPAPKPRRKRESKR